MALSKTEILDTLKDGPCRIYGGPPRDIYFDLQELGLIEMRNISIDSQETAVEVKLSKAGDSGS
jgi:hypothetical protein